MDKTRLLELTQQVALDMAGSSVIQPFSPDKSFFRVGEKWFAFIADVDGERHVVLKVEPEYGKALREEYPQIRTGWHMNKKHWISFVADDEAAGSEDGAAGSVAGSVEADGAGPDPYSRNAEEALLVDLIVQSYMLILETLPSRLVPIGATPEWFAIGQ